jgi:type IX secretion system PorP/SprF family membrane protein
MKVILNYLIILLLLKGGMMLSQQVSLFNTYSLDPLQLNIAYAGAACNEVNAHYRTQWIGMKEAPKALQLNAQSAFGKYNALALRVNSQTQGLLTILGSTFGYSYRFKVSETAKVHFGLGIGFTQASLNSQNAIVIDLNDVNLNNNIKQTANGFDSEFGAMFIDNKLKAGISVLHLYNTNPDFNGSGAYKTLPQLNSQVSYVFQKDKKCEIEPWLVNRYTLQGNNVFEGIINFNFIKTLSLGVGYRSYYGAMALVGAKLGNIKVAYSFDYGTSKNATNLGTSHQVMIGYSICKTANYFINKRTSRKLVDINQKKNEDDLTDKENNDASEKTKEPDEITKSETLIALEKAIETEKAKTPNNIAKSETLVALEKAIETEKAKTPNNINKSETLIALEKAVETEKAKTPNNIAKSETLVALEKAIETEKAKTTNSIAKSETLIALEKAVETEKAKNTNTIGKSETLVALEKAVETEKAKNTNIIAKSETLVALEKAVETEKAKTPNNIAKSEALVALEKAVEAEKAKTPNNIAKSEALVALEKAVEAEKAKTPNSIAKSETLIALEKAVENEKAKIPNNIAKSEALVALEKTIETEKAKTPNSIAKSETLVALEKAVENEKAKNPNKIAKSEKLIALEKAVESEKAKNTNNKIKSEKNTGVEKEKTNLASSKINEERISDEELLKINTEIISKINAIAVDVVFDLNSSQLQENGLKRLNEIADIIKQNPRLKINITGHTCIKGTKEFNDILSVRRATYVRQELMKRGVNRKNFNRNVGKGSSDPLFDNSSSNQPKNRTIRFVLAE